jgi:hypothetical protein
VYLEDSKQPSPHDDDDTASAQERLPPHSHVYGNQHCQMEPWPQPRSMETACPVLERGRWRVDCLVFFLMHPWRHDHSCCRYDQNKVCDQLERLLFYLDCVSSSLQILHVLLPYSDSKMCCCLCHNAADCWWHWRWARTERARG